MIRPTTASGWRRSMKPLVAHGRWPGVALLMVVIGVGVLAAPAAIEGPVLLPISPGHALSVLDAIGVLPLVAGALSLYYGLWLRRGRLYLIATRAPAAAAWIVFGGGFGLGLLIASAFAAFFWWWAVGAALYGTALLAAVLGASRETLAP